MSPLIAILIITNFITMNPTWAQSKKFDVNSKGEIINPDAIPSLPTDSEISKEWKCGWVGQYRQIDSGTSRFCDGTIACNNPKIEALKVVKMQAHIRCTYDPEVGCNIFSCFMRDELKNTQYRYSGKPRVKTNTSETRKDAK